MSNGNLFKISILQPKMDILDLESGIKNPNCKNRKASYFKKEYLQAEVDFDLHLKDKFRMVKSSHKKTKFSDTPQIYNELPSQGLKKTRRLQSARVKRQQKNFNQYVSVEFTPSNAVYAWKSNIRKSDKQKIRRKFPALDTAEFMLKKQQLYENQMLIVFWKLKMKFVRLIQYNPEATWGLANHESIVKVYGIVKWNEKEYVVTDYLAGSSLKGIVEEFGRYRENLISEKIRKLVIAVSNCHNKYFVHGRIHPDNLWTNREGDIFLDLVSSNENFPTEKEKLKNFYYYPPEVLLEQSMGPKADVWGIGCATLFMIEGNFEGSPFHPYSNNYFFSPPLGKRKTQDRKQVRNLQIKFGSLMKENYQHSNVEDYISKEAKTFLKACLSISYETRPDLALLIDHPFLLQKKR